MVRRIIEGMEKTRFDRAHFKRFADSSLEFEVVYYVPDRDFNVYMDIQQRINLELFRGLKAEGVDFAYPTRTLYVRHEGTENAQERMA
jgi:small-conductance mechanosensitive channel